MKRLLRFLGILIIVLVLSGAALYMAVRVAVNPASTSSSVFVIGVIVVLSVLLILNWARFSTWLINLFRK